MEEEHAIQTNLFVSLDFTQEIYIPSNSQETSLKMYTHVLDLMTEMLMDLNWK